MNYHTVMTGRNPKDDAAPPHDCRQARVEMRVAVREAAIDAAVELLEAEGPEGVTVRRVASMVGASTQVIYTLFGGKPGLAGAVFGRGHELLSAALLAAPTSGDARADLRAKGQAYRRHAQENPHLYAVMFGNLLGEMKPDERAIAAAGASFSTLVEAIVRCQEEGSVRAGGPVEIARIVFATCHGASALELSGRQPPGLDLTRTYEQLLDTLLRGLAP